MANISQEIYKMRFLDEQSCRHTLIHDLHPLCKLLVTIAYLITVTSFEKYSLSSILPLVFYPVIIISLAELPVVPLLKRILPVLPFVIGIGIFNPFFDKRVLAYISGITVTGGWVSFLVLVIKCALLVLAALILIATTGMDGTAAALRLLWVPKIFTLQLLLTYRYISVLADEAHRVSNAYSLRAPGQKGIRFSEWGSLAGQMLIRTIDRAQRVYHAMELRGFNGEYNTGYDRAIYLSDVFYMVLWIAFFILARFIDIPAVLGMIWR